MRGNKSKSLHHIYYVKLGIAIFVTLCLKIIANTIEITETITALRKINSKDIDEGK
jgi:hypothetical protein